jgi:hypothetical protein
MSAQKVLVTGPIQSLSSYFTKLATLQSKHSFDLVLAQDLFSNITDQDDEDLTKLLNGDIKVPVQVYAAWGKGNLPEKVKERFDRGEEITTNLSVLRELYMLLLLDEA